MPISVTSQPLAISPLSNASCRRVATHANVAPQVNIGPAMPSKVGSQTQSQLLDILAEKIGIGYSANVVLAENRRLEHI